MLGWGPGGAIRKLDPRGARAAARVPGRHARGVALMLPLKCSRECSWRGEGSRPSATAAGARASWQHEHVSWLCTASMARLRQRACCLPCLLSQASTFSGTLGAQHMSALLWLANNSSGMLEWLGGHLLLDFMRLSQEASVAAWLLPCACAGRLPSAEALLCVSAQEPWPPQPCRLPP